MPCLASTHVCLCDETACANLPRTAHTENPTSHLIYLIAAIPQATSAVGSIPARSPPTSSQMATYNLPPTSTVKTTIGW
jgi:hypothetical protein